MTEPVEAGLKQAAAELETSIEDAVQAFSQSQPKVPEDTAADDHTATVTTEEPTAEASEPTEEAVEPDSTTVADVAEPTLTVTAAATVVPEQQPEVLIHAEPTAPTPAAQETVEAKTEAQPEPEKPAEPVMAQTESGRAYNDPREIRRRQQEAKRLAEQRVASEQTETATPVQDVSALPDQPEPVVDPVAQIPVAEQPSESPAPTESTPEPESSAETVQPERVRPASPEQADLPIDTIESPASADATGDDDHAETHDLRQQQEEEPKP